MYTCRERERERGLLTDQPLIKKKNINLPPSYKNGGEIRWEIAILNEIKLN